VIFKVKLLFLFISFFYLYDFLGPRSALSSHLQECAYKDKTDSTYLKTKVFYLTFSNFSNSIIKGMLKEPIVPGRLCTLELHRGYADLGIHIVGGGKLVHYSSIMSFNFKKV
jgi:hypothetical protein